MLDEKEKLDELKNDLDLDQIEDLLTNLGGEPIRRGSLIMSKTICHCGDSHKLYYYDNTKLFRCFTECSDTFDVYQLVMKVKESNGEKCALPQAINFVKQYFGISDENQDFLQDKSQLQDWEILKKYEKNTAIMDNKIQIVELKTFDKTILSRLPHPRILPWEHEGISKEVIKSHDICYNPVSEAIVVPHYNINGELVGIRERTLIKENEEFGKYRPSILNRKMYNHPLGFNLYNINFSKDNIKRVKKAIVFESEKSCLKYASFFGEENDISVAVCGSSISKHQFQILLDLGIEELIIAFDRQYQKIGDIEYKSWTKKLLDISKKFNSFCKISFIFDTKELLGYKDAPIDLTPEIFLQLYYNRLDSDGHFS